MPDLGELVAVALPELVKNDCPFCAEEKTDKKETLQLEDHTSEDTTDANEADDGSFRLRNDSGRLAEALGARPAWEVVIELASRNSPPFIDAGYFLKREQNSTSGKYYLRSNACPNAHHLIPGNDSLGRATDLLKWMAGTVEWKRVRYKEIPEGMSPSSLKTMRRGGSVTTVSKDEDDNIVVVQRVETSTGRMKEEKRVNISGRVTGKVDYDVNAAANGVWLPGNNAVDKWSKLESAIKTTYIKTAIEATKSGAQHCQFHDAHKKYSSEVRRQLDDLAAEIDMIAEKCLSDESHTSGDAEPLPAPRRLRASLNAVSSLLKTKCVGNKASWVEPWLTSNNSLLAK